MINFGVLLNQTIKISTPGRVCLFGEHQDYLHLPVIACAISKRIFIEGTKRNDSKVKIDLPDVSQTEEFAFNGILPYELERDYFKSSVNVLLKDGFTFSNGIDVLVHGEIPINAGTSSSSALIVTWINLLTRLSDQELELSPEKIAELAYRAEVLEFSEPGGMMDHYSTSVGNIIWLGSYPDIQIEKMNAKPGAFVLGNSGEPKDTKNILARVKNGVLKIVDELRKIDGWFSLQTATVSSIEEYRNLLDEEKFKLLAGTVRNRDITIEAKKILQENPIDNKKIGMLLNEHQKVLRDDLKISTPKIDTMIQAALDAGACGAKINGSGGGGCMFAYAPENTERVFAALNKIGKEVFIIFPDEGTHKEIKEEHLL